MSVPVGRLGEAPEAASAWKWLLSGVRSNMVLHGSLFGKAIPTLVADQCLLEPPGVYTSHLDHLVGGCFVFGLTYFFGVLMHNLPFLTIFLIYFVRFNHLYLRLWQLSQRLNVTHWLWFRLHCIYGSWYVEGPENGTCFLLSSSLGWYQPLGWWYMTILCNKFDKGYFWLFGRNLIRKVMSWIFLLTRSSFLKSDGVLYMFIYLKSVLLLVVWVWSVASDMVFVIISFLSNDYNRWDLRAL